MGKTMQYLTFRIPSKSNEFKPEIFPPTPSNQPVWSDFAEWSSNATKPPNMYTFEDGVHFLDDTDLEAGWSAKGG